VNVQIFIHGADGVTALLGRMMRAADGATETLASIGDYVKESTRRRFIESRAPDGAPWKPVLRGGTPLRNTSTHLFNAISYRVGADSVTVSVPHAWAAAHQFGAQIKPKNGKYLRFRYPGGYATVKGVTIPARPFFGINRDDSDAIGAIIRNRIAGSAA